MIFNEIEISIFFWRFDLVVFCSLALKLYLFILFYWLTPYLDIFTVLLFRTSYILIASWCPDIKFEMSLLFCFLNTHPGCMLQFSNFNKRNYFFKML